MKDSELYGLQELVQSVTRHTNSKIKENSFKDAILEAVSLIPGRASISRILASSTKKEFVEQLSDLQRFYSDDSKLNSDGTPQVSDPSAISAPKKLGRLDLDYLLASEGDVSFSIHGSTSEIHLPPRRTPQPLQPSTSPSNSSHLQEIARSVSGRLVRNCACLKAGQNSLPQPSKLHLTRPPD